VLIISQKLDRARDYIIKGYGVEGRLEPVYQHAVRILDSRKRELWRMLFHNTRPADDPDRRKAEIELSVKRRDNGLLFRWLMSNHSYGRLGCAGCAYDYIREERFGLPVKVVMARLCPVCGQGIQHSIVADTPDEAQAGVRAFRSVVGVDIAATMRREATQQDVGAIHKWPALVYVCDVCCAWGIEHVD
jgi:hypothetical protein